MFIFVLLLSSLYAQEFTKPIESRVRVAVVDTGLDLSDVRFKDVLCKDGHKDFTNTTLKDTYGHGTHVVGSIIEHANSNNYCLIILKFWNSNSTPPRLNAIRAIQAFNHAVALGVKIVNYSGGGEGFSQLEYNIIKNNQEVIFIAAAGNDGREIKNDYAYYPASYDLPNVISVGSLTNDGKKAITSNYGKKVKMWEVGENVKSYAIGNGYARLSGTSMATAIVTGRLINGYVNRQNAN